MPKQLNVDLRFNADVSQAKQQIVSLQQSLNQLTNSLALGKTKDLGLTESVGKAIIKVQELQSHLDKAMNVNTGRIDFSKFNQSLQKSNTSLQSYASQLLKLGPQGQQAFFQLSNAIAMSEIPLRRSSGLLQQFGVTLRNTLRWQISSTMFHGLISGVRTAYNYAKDLNESLNNIRIVTGQSTEQMAKFAEQANKAAQALGTTTTKYTDAALIFYQQGIRDENEIAKRTDATIKMANVSGQSAEQVSSQLTAIWNNFADGSKSLEYYADVITALGASTASSSEEIAQGLSKFAAVADTVGLSYEKASAALATVVAETRQSADTVGTAFKTILARLESVNLGETLEDGVTLTKYSEALQKVGVNILDQQGHLKQMDTILDELGSKWQKLSEEQQVALANTVGGVRQYAQFMALMNNYDKVRANETTALSSRGTLEEQQKIYAESWEAASKRSKAALEDLYSSLINDKFFIQLTNAFTGITKEISNIIKSIGGLGGVLTGLGAILTNVFSQQLTDRLSMMGYNIKMMTEAGRNQVIEQKISSLENMANISGQYFNGNIKVNQYLPNEETPKEGVYASEIVRENYKQLIELQIQLSKNSKYMSEQEIKDAERLLQIRGQINDKIIETLQKATQAEEQQYNAERQIYAELANILDISTSKASSVYASDVADLKEIDTLLVDLKNNGLKPEDMVPEEILERLGKLGIEIRENMTVEEAQQELLKAGLNIEDHFTKELTVRRSTIQKLRDSTQDYTQALYDNEQQQRNANDANKQFKIQLEQAQQAVASLSGMIVASAQGLLSIVSIMTTLNSMIKTLSNPNASGWEKFTAVLRGTAMTILMMSSVMRAFNRVLENKTRITAKQSLITTLDTLAEHLNTKAKEKNSRANTENSATVKANTDAKTKQAEANLLEGSTQEVSTGTKKSSTLGGAFKNFGSSFFKNYGGQLAGGALVLAGIAVAVTTATAVVKHFNEEINKVKAASEALTQVQNSYQSLSETVDNFNNTISSYQEGVEGLKELEQGTIEYKEQVIKANAEAMKLLESYRGLKYELRDGLIVIDDNSLEEATEKKIKELEQAQMAVQAAQQELTKANLEVEKTNFKRDKLKTNSEFLVDYGNTAVASGAGAASGALIGTGASMLSGASLGAAIGSAAPVIGTAIGAAVGLVVGGIVSAVNGQQMAAEEEAIQKLVKLYEQNGNVDFATKETLVNALKTKLQIDDKDLIDSLTANKNATLQLVEQIAQSNKQEDLYYEQLAEQNFGEKLKEQANEDEDLYQALLHAIAERLKNNVEQSYKDAWKDQSFGKKDKTIQQEYAQKNGYTWLKNNNNNTGTYLINGEEQIIADDTARRWLAEQEQLELIQQNLDITLKNLINVIQEITNKIPNIDKIDGLEGKIQTGLQTFTGNENGNFLNLTKEDFNSLGILDISDIEKIINNWGLTEEQAKSFGYESLDIFKQAINTSLTNAFKAVDTNSLFNSQIGDTLEKFNEKTNFFDKATGAQNNAVINSFNKVFEVGGEKGLQSFSKAMESIFNQIEDPEKFKELAEQMSNLDWENWNIDDQIKNVFQNLDLSDIDTSAFDNVVEQMREATNAAYEFDLSNFIDQMYASEDFFDKLKYGDLISAKDLEKIKEEQEELYNFITTAGNGWVQDGSGYRFLGNKEEAEKNYNNQRDKDLEDNISQTNKNVGEIATVLEKYNNEYGTNETNIDEILSDPNKKSNLEALYHLKGIPTEPRYVFDPFGVKPIGTTPEHGGKGDAPGVKAYDSLKKFIEENEVLSGAQIVESEPLDLGGEGLYVKYYIDFDGKKFNNFQDLENYLIEKGEIDSLDTNISSNNDNAESIKESYEALALGSSTIDELNEKIINGQVALENYDEIFEKVLTKELGAAGADLEEFNNQVQYLIDTYDLERQQALNIAAANAKMNLGIKDLSSNFENYKKILHEGSNQQSEYASTLKNFTKTLDNLLDIDTSEFAEQWIKDSKKLSLIEEAAKGDADAINQLRAEAAKELIFGIDYNESDFTEIEAEINNLIDQLTQEDIKIGTTLDNDALAQSLYEALQQSGKTADEIQEVFDRIGWKPTVTTETYTLQDEDVRRGYVEVPANIDALGNEGPKIQRIPIESSMTAGSTISYPVINGQKMTYQGSPKQTVNTSSKPSSKGGGGGSGGGERKKKDLKKASDEIERYHKIDKTIDSLSKQYDRLSAAKDKAFGTSRLRLIERENALLQQQTEAEKARLEEVKKYYAEDRSAIEAYGAVIDENGVISNYDEIMQQELDRLNAAYEEYNAGGLSDEIIEAKEKEYEEFKKILEQFEKTNSEYLDQLQKVEEAIRAEITAELERIQAKVEVQLELPDQQLKMIEFKLSRLEDRAFSSGEKIALWGKQAEIAGNKFNILYSSLEEIFTLQDENGDWSGLNLTADQAQRLLAGDKTVLDEIKLTGENAAEIMEALKTKQDELIEQYNTMVDAMKSIEEELTNQLDEYNEAIEKQISKMEKLGSIAQAMKDTINAVGKEVIGVPASVMRSINNNILKSSEARANAYKAEYEAQTKALIAAREALGKAQTEEDKKYWQDMIDTTEEAMNDAKESMLAQIQDYAEQAATIFEETLTESLATMAKNMYGMTVDDAQAAFDRYTTLSEDFLQDYQKIYELSKMTRSIQASINDIDNIKAKQALRDLQEEINEYQAEGVQMTQYEVDYLNKKYELRLAEIALEEAQNAKDQVRLSRNADGGWGYVYTANQQNIDQAQQSYEDKLKELQDLNYQMLQETQSGILGLQKEFNDALMEIYSRRDLSKEEQEKQINSLRDFYIRRAKTLGTSLDTALANNKDTYDFWSNNRYGYGVSAPGNYIDTYGETFLGSLNPALTSGTNLANSFVTQIGDINTPGSIIGDSYQSWWDYTNEVSNMFGLIANDGETLEEAINREMTGISEDIDNTTDKVHELAQTMGEELPAAIENVSNIQSQWGPVLDEAAELIENLGTAIEGLIEKMNEYNDIDLKPLDIPDSSGLSSRYTAAIAASGDGNGGGGSGNGGGGSYGGSGNPENDTKNYQKSSIITLNFTQPWYNNRLFSWSSYDSNELDKKLKEYYNNNSSSIMSYFQKNKNNSNYGKYLNWGASDVVYGPYYSSFKQWVRDVTGISFDTGGYTGKFGPEGKLAMLHEKELVLNKQDTLNMLKMVALARDALGQVSIGSSLIAQTAASGYASGQTGFNSQNVSIEAHFPNVVDHNEIEQAFNNLANYAAQNAYNFDLPQRVNLF